MHTFSGAGRQRGEAHGEELRPLIHATLERVVESLGGPDEVERFVAETNFESAIATYTPDLLSEFDGIAAAAAVPRKHLLAHNLMDEHWWWSQVRGRRESCSTLGTPGPPAMLGQTMDLPTTLDGSQVLVVNQTPDGARTAVLTSAGLVGLCGASSAGFAVCVNALTTLEHSTSGLPVAFVMRGALAQPDAAAALTFIRSVAHASGQHYAVVGRAGDGSIITGSVECSAFGAVDAAAPNSAFGHANHPLATPDIDPHMVPTESRSELRQSILEEQGVGVASLDQMCDLLTARPICIERRPGSDWFTFGTIAAEIREPREIREPGGSVTLRVALGPASQEEWHEIAV